MIRKAQIEDLETIFQLYKHYTLDIAHINDSEYATKVQQNGFLVDVGSKKDFEERIPTNYLFNVYEVDKKVVAYIIINKEVYFPEDADNITWFSEEWKQKYFHSDTSITLHEIIVDKDFIRTGIATELLNNAIDQLRKDGYSDLYAIIATGPLTDCPSIIFHTKNKFERACISLPDDLFGIKNYESLLMHKQIN